MNFQEILKSDIAHYDEEQRQFSPCSQKDQSVKTDVNHRRNKLIGEIFMVYFPESECFHPQLNKAANEDEFKPLAEFLEKISKLKTIEKCWKQTVQNKCPEAEIVSSEEA